MTKLYDGQIADLLQNDGRYSPEIIAISYAVLQEKRRIMDRADKTRTASMIDHLSEDILDLLAVELRSPYYAGDMPIEKKRGIVKNTLVWFSKAGTTAALEELIFILFGQGEIVEWFDFTEPPYTPGTFDIITDSRMTEDAVGQFLQIIRKVKNTRSHLRRVIVERIGTMKEYIGAGIITAPKTHVLNGGLSLDRDIDEKQAVKAGTVSAPRETIVNHFPERERTTRASVTAKAVLMSAPSEQITNQAPERDRSANGTGKTGAGVISAPTENIVNHAPERAEAAKGTARIGAALAVRDTHIIISNCPSPSVFQIGQTQKTFAAAAARSSIII